MPAFTNVNIKDLTQIEEVVSGNLLLIETETGTNTINFDNFVVGPDNVSWYTAFETVSGQVATLSADLGNVNYTERSAVTALSAEVQLLETQFYALTSNVTTLSSNFLALSSNVVNPTAIVITAPGVGSTTFPLRWNTVKVTTVGGGGGGGGVSNATAAPAAAGGGAGQLSIGYFSGVGGRVYQYKVGVGGAGGANTGGNGFNGDVTHLTIPVLGANFGVSANGGLAGNGSTSNSSTPAGGSGGSGSGGQALITISGNPGQLGIGSATFASAVGGNGGPGYLGLGTGYGNNAFTSLAQGAGGAGTSGTGAGGGGARANGTGQTGGQGGSGIIIIEFIA